MGRGAINILAIVAIVGWVSRQQNPTQLGAVGFRYLNGTYEKSTICSSSVITGVILRGYYYLL